MKALSFLITASLCGFVSSAHAAPPQVATPQPVARQAAATATAPSAMMEAESLLQAKARLSQRPAYDPAKAVKFPASYHVFLPSVLAIDFTYRNAWVELPLYMGMGPDMKPNYYVVTEASDFSIAKRLGLNYAPKMQNALNSDGVQRVTIKDGVIQFKGMVDFRPVRKVVHGSPMPFPPKIMNPGQVADGEWSSFVQTPENVVYNIQVMANWTGRHDRAIRVDMKKMVVRFKLLDGFQDGKQYFYHMVTDASDLLPAALEDGVLAPKLAKLPKIGDSSPDRSALLGFSPVLNGPMTEGGHEYQGFAYALTKNATVDPINVFPFGPDNDNASATNNYSPMWDAHISQWTQRAFDEKKVRRIKSFPDLEQLIKDGYIASADINPPGAGNGFVGGLRPTEALINCPIIAHPELPER